MSGFLKNRNPFSFMSNTGNRFTIYGESAEEALMEHLCVQTKLAGHQLSFEEANDQNIGIMIAPREFASYFGSFEEAARMAWDTLSAEAAQKLEKFRFKMNNGDVFVKVGVSEKDVLMEHLIEKTRQVGRQLKFDEANDPNFIVMVKPRVFAFVFKSFDLAAETAWKRVRAKQYQAES